MAHSIFTQLKEKYLKGGIVEKLIFVNVSVFVVTFFIGGLSKLFNNQQNIINEWFSLPANLSSFILKPWTIVSYGFLHGGFFHLFLNMLCLYYIGRLFLDYFIPRKLLNFYLMGTICGGILFLITFSYFPALQNMNAFLVGASAGVMAILVGIATHIPHYELKFPLIGFVKLWVIAAVFIGLDLIRLNDNTGGRFAHLGGAIYGFIAIYYKDAFKLKKSVTNLFQKKSPLKTSYKSAKPKKTTNSNRTHQQKIDLILDKISKSGYESLSKEEKEFLFQQGKK